MNALRAPTRFAVSEKRELKRYWSVLTCPHAPSKPFTCTKNLVNSTWWYFWWYWKTSNQEKPVFMRHTALDVNDALPPVLSSPESKPVPKAHASGLSYWGKAWCFAANDFRTLISFRKRYVIHAPNAAISGGQLSSTFRYSSSIFQSTSHMFPHSTCDVRILPLSMLGLSLVKRLVNFDLWEYHKSNGKPQIKW